MSVHAIVPVKHAGHGKQRLASVLDAEGRERLVRAMLADVVAALRACADISTIWIVTPDATLVPGDCSHVADPGRGLNAAISAALERAAADGARRVLVIPADVPEVGAEEIHELLDAARSADVVVATDAAARGTNALVLGLPARMGPQFGEDSRRRHDAAARAAGLRYALLTPGGIARDVDLPEDLASLAARHRRYAALSPRLQEVV